MPIPVRRVAPVALAAMLLAGCGGGGAPPAPPATTTKTARSVSAHPVVLRAVATRSLTVWTRPGGKVAGALSARTPYGSPRTLLVERVEQGWVKVLLPRRPNGSTGWVKAADVTLAQVTDTITVNLAARTVTVVIHGKAPLTASVAVGTAADPTPKGRFYVTDRIATSDPKGAYGPLALGLSAHSTVLATFGAGDAQIGIHGTNEPKSIGKSASHGCIRVPPSVVALLWDVPLGTPVTIRS